MGIDKVHFKNSKIHLLENFLESGICAKIRGVYGNFMRKFKKEDMVPDGCWLKT